MAIPQAPIDYVLVLDAYARHVDGPSPTRQVVRFDTPINVTGDIYVGRLERSLAEAIIDACEPAGENFHPVRQYNCSYAFYRENASPDGNPWRFDVDNALFICITLSRIVHPTSAGFTHAARVRRLPDGRREIFPPGPTAWFLDPSAYVVEPRDNWLVPDDLPTLTALIDAYNSKTVPQRAITALFHHEASARQYYINFRWPLLTTALEALVKIRHERLPSGGHAGSTKVFVDRLLAVGDIDSSLAVPEADLREMYEYRSLLSHGLGFPSLDAGHKSLYLAQDRLARGIIRKAFLDVQFRDIFTSDAKLAAGLPLRQS